MEEARFGTRIAIDRGGTWLLGVTGDELAKLRRPALRADPYPQYAHMRGMGPLYRSRTGMWAVATHAECDQVLRDRRFGVQHADGRPYRMVQTLMRARGIEEVSNFLVRDAPDHTRLRKLALPAFRPSKIDSYRAMVEKTAHALLDRATDAGSFDLMTSFAGPLPIQVISALLGITNVDVQRFLQFGKTVAESLAGIRSGKQVRVVRETTRQMHAMFEDIAARKRADPGDDVITTLVQAYDNGEMNLAELTASCELLLVAGFETTVNLIGNGVHALLSNPEQWAALRDDPGLGGAVVEETLRYDAPVQSTVRVAHEDLELAGQPIARDSLVFLMLGSAGRDPAAFSDPDKFDINRKPENDHLGFANGVHFCLGAQLARLEGEIAFRALAERVPNLSMNGKPERRLNSQIRGLQSFPVRT